MEHKIDEILSEEFAKMRLEEPHRALVLRVESRRFRWPIRRVIATVSRVCAAAAMVALGATAQNKAIDLMAETYGTVEGYTVVNLEGDLVKGLTGMLGGGQTSGTITLDDGTTYSADKLLDGISSVTAIIPTEKANEGFIAEARSAIGEGDYKTIVSLRMDNSSVKVMMSELKKGRFRGEEELVALVDDDGMYVLVRLIGKIDEETIGKMIEKMNSDR